MICGDLRIPANSCLAKEGLIWENIFLIMMEISHTISRSMAIDSDGDLLMRMGDNMAMDMDSGNIHFISGWLDDNDND